MKNSKIILTGYRATGKSSIGKLLATKLAFDFVDMDLVIEKRQDCTIKEMVAAQGWAYFRSLEKELLQELAGQDGAMVIATGGGAILHEDVWAEIMAAGLVVWLNADKYTICQRLQDDEKTASQRPALTDTDTFLEIETVLNERKPLYSKGCHLRVDTDSKTIEQITAIIEEKLIAS